MSQILMKEKGDPRERFSSDLISISIGCVLLVCTFVFSVQPAGAASITLNENSIYLPMAAGSTATNSSLDITVTSLLPFTVSVEDSSGRSSHLGYMGNYTDGAYVTGGPVLASPLRLAGTSSLASAQPITPPITDDPQTLYIGLTSILDKNLGPNTFSQDVAITDPHLRGDSTYRIDLTFTITTL